MQTPEEIISLIQLEYPGFSVVPKENSKLMKVIGFVLKVITFGLLDGFMIRFTTTIGLTVYTPLSWGLLPDEGKAVVLLHERVHLQQARQYGRFGFALRYLFFPFPFLWANYRVRFEQEAYAVSIRETHARGGDVFSASYRESMIRHFTTSEYLWMSRDRASIERWFDGVVDSLKTTQV